MASRLDKGVNVQVLLRCRPFSDEEIRTNAPQVVTCNDYQREVAVSQNIAGKQIDRVFTFDKVFGPSAQQKDLYDQAVVPIVNEVLEGFNCTIFAYGQTGTGKTYTMEGECRKARSGSKGQLPPEAGVIPRAVKQIFDTLESQNAEYSVKVTFIELYNEEITDLLAPEELTKPGLDEKQRKQLLLMEDGKGGVLVRGIEEEIVTSANEIFTLLERGSSKRRTAETLLNKQSSRSHSLFSITIHIKEATPEGEELIKCGKLNLVDLAGSENISRSGAREGRAREAGEINKSLLTLGRVISALVEHLGHVPYRDSKLTRLLRDSLGGRTKTCIIATVSPAVHCLEETLSTLDYAHRAKNIRNKPEVNQKMMKSTLIKDLYGEIDRLKAEVYASREKNGVYIPKDRYYQEENERKAMADQIDQMSITLESNQKQIEELQDKYEAQVQDSSDLRCKLEDTENRLDQTSKLLAKVDGQLKESQYSVKERDFIISEQRKAENALIHQACVLRSELEKSLKDNSLLFSKIAREDKLSAENRSVVDDFQAYLSQNIKTLCSTVTTSMSEQHGHLERVEKLCSSLLEIHEKLVSDITKKMAASRALYSSHMEAMQNVVHLHKASNNAGLDEISSSALGNASSIKQHLETMDEEASSIFSDLQCTLSSQQGELALFAKELREKFHFSMEHTKETSNTINGFLNKLGEQSVKLQSHTSHVHDVQHKNIAEFQRVYEEQAKSESEKLLAGVTNLFSSYFHRQNDLVNAKLNTIKDTITGNKEILDEQASSLSTITMDAKRKWEELSTQSENDARDGADFSAAKHCRMEIFLQKCVSSVESASEHFQKTHNSVNEMSSEHASAIGLLVRNVSESNEQHDLEIMSTRKAAEEDVAKNNEHILLHFESVSKCQRESISSILGVVEAQTNTLHKMQDDHSGQTMEIDQQAESTFQRRYMDYEPSGTTPIKSEIDVPSNGAIESLRTMPLDSLLEEFRENHPYEASNAKEIKPSLIPRSPLLQLN